MKQVKFNLLAIIGMMVAVGTVAFTAPKERMIDAQDQIWVYLDNTAANHDNPSRYNIYQGLHEHPFFARVFLSIEDYQNAFVQANNVINRYDVYTGLNYALLKECFKGEYPHIEIDFPKVKLGNNSGLCLHDIGFEILTRRSFYVYWSMPDSPVLFCMPSDRIYIIVYNIAQQKFSWSEFVNRDREEVIVKCPEAEAGDRFALYAFAIDIYGNKSTNRFLGEGRFR